MFAESNNKQAHLLKNELESVLVALRDAPPDFQYLIRQPLTRTLRESLDNTKARQWPRLSLMVCEATSGQFEQAIPLAVSLELFMAAADVFDDVEDADSPQSLAAKYGNAVATNVGTVLLVLAEKALARLGTKGVEKDVILHITDVANSLYTTACTGQHLDLSLNSPLAVSEDEYLKVAYMKSASVAECACRIGALVANANKELVDTFSLFGRNLGMLSQIANDIRGITQGSDIVKHKITLPIIYAFTNTDDEIRSQLALVFSKQEERIGDPDVTKDLLFSTGAIHYATVKMELYRQLAMAALGRATEAGAAIEPLKSFLE